MMQREPSNRIAIKRNKHYLKAYKALINGGYRTKDNRWFIRGFCTHMSIILFKSPLSFSDIDGDLFLIFRT